MNFEIQGNPNNPATERSLVLLAQALTASNPPSSVGKAVAIEVGIVAKPMRVDQTPNGKNLTGRKRLHIQAQGSGFTWGLEQPLPGQALPFTMKPDEIIPLLYGEGITVWVVKATGTAKVAVAEVA